MWKATISGLRAHKLRLGLTALSIVLGVAFVSGTLILTDTLHNTFDQLFGGVYGKISVQVRQPSPVKGDHGDKTYVPMPMSTLPQVASLPGVKAAEGSVGGFAQIIDKKGKAIAPQGPPLIGASFGTVPEISGFSLASGRAPVGGSEVVIDKGTADKYHFQVGDQVRILFQGPPRQFNLVGIVKFGKANGLAGATMAQFELPTAQQVLNRVGQYDTVDLLAKPGVSASSLRSTVTSHLRPGYEAITGSQLAKESANQVNKGLGIFTTFLLVFALISLFVGSFIILNTFSILVAQRTREYALFRALGASRKQILASTLGEAAVVGLFASIVGIAAGALIATGLEAVFASFGSSLPSYGLTFQPRTVVIGLVIGVGISMIAAVNPARRASKISPIAALGDPLVDSAGSLGRRAVVGTISLVIGLFVMMMGLFVAKSGQAALVGVGIAVTFLGVATLAPLVARPVAGIIGAPLRRTSGVAGVLARQNAMRNPRRTAATASALMIGLALVTMFSVFGQSAKASISHSIDQTFSADYVLKTSNFGNFSPDVEQRVASVPGVAAYSPERTDRALYKTSTVTMTGVDANSIGKVLRVDVKSGSLGSLAKGQMMVEEKAAKSKHWTVGTPVQLTFAKTGPQTFVVGGTYKSNQLLGSNYLVSTKVFESNFTDQFDQVVMVKLASGADPNTVRTHLEDAVAQYPNVTVSDAASVKKDQAKQVNQLLNIIYVMLALAVIIAVLGIINTLVLSVVERTRELGLLRAIGMIRRQVRRMIRGESVVIALFGALLGLGVGTGFGVALTKAVITSSQGGVISVPIVSLVMFLVLATVFGVLAAVWPARRAAKTNVLAALQFE